MPDIETVGVFSQNALALDEEFYGGDTSHGATPSWPAVGADNVSNDSAQSQEYFLDQVYQNA